jgi:glutathione S-transferase
MYSMLPNTAAVTLLALLLYFYMSLNVGRARVTFGVKAPATAGQPEFERLFRVHMNTLEWMPIFLPALWLCAFYVGDYVAAGLGIVWIVGRILYMVGYTKAAEKRNIGFGIQALAAGVLLVSALVGVVMRMIEGA